MSLRTDVLRQSCPRALSDLELLMRLARVSEPRARRAFGSCPDLLSLSRTWSEVSGENSTEVQLGLVCEFARRMHVAWASPKHALSNPASVARWGMAMLSEILHEELWVVGLNARQEQVAAICVGRGGLHSVRVCVPEVLRAVLRFGVSQFVMLHNHPSGDPTPSPDDVTLTHRVQRASNEIGVELMDHVVIAGVSYVSMYESGYLRGRTATSGLHEVAARC